jgi:exosortase C (VPDSG-CTERM-specific)
MSEAERTEHAAAAEFPADGSGTNWRKSWRAFAAASYAVALAVCFAPTLAALAAHALASELHSHVLLIPFISMYLVYIDRDRLPKDRFSSWGLGFIAAISGAVVLSFPSVAATRLQPLSHNDYLAVMTLAFLCWLIAGGFFFLGKTWMASVAFPAAFLIFMIPMPDGMETALETASKLGSAEVTHVLFNIFGVPLLRDGLVFQLPGITIEVAQECSGIRSSWVLLITSLLASHLFLRTTWRRTLLVLFVIPLGLIRNGFRILVIAILCVEIGPEMIDSFAHRRGGPIFFALSLLPLFGLLWWLRASEGRKQPRVAAAAADHHAR